MLKELGHPSYLGSRPGTGCTSAACKDIYEKGPKTRQERVTTISVPRGQWERSGGEEVQTGAGGQPRLQGTVQAEVKCLVPMLSQLADDRIFQRQVPVSFSYNRVILFPR
jgi:hypothetical protein